MTALTRAIEDVEEQWSGKHRKYVIGTSQGVIRVGFWDAVALCGLLPTLLQWFRRIILRNKYLQSLEDNK